MTLPGEIDLENNTDSAQTILIVDDDIRFLNLMHDVLSVQGYRVLKASSGQTGVELYRENYPDLVFLDLSMPDMNGLQVLDAIQEIDENAIVIVITAYGTVELAVAAMQQGAVDFVEKLDYTTNIQETLFRKVETVLEDVNGE
ncbi:MAG: response regulator [Candidatus Latescibacteria bacterium]|jgi:two-component system, NtrC family, response regulator AtoC|nr:response regulator [Candidatus Latescibacterota bacterium]